MAITEKLLQMRAIMAFDHVYPNNPAITLLPDGRWHASAGRFMAVHDDAETALDDVLADMFEALGTPDIATRTNPTIEAGRAKAFAPAAKASAARVTRRTQQAREAEEATARQRDADKKARDEENVRGAREVVEQAAERQRTEAAARAEAEALGAINDKRPVPAHLAGKPGK